jgi:hypothetical protein
MRPEVKQRTSVEAAAILLIRVGVLAFILAGLAKTWADPDLWGHVRFGGDILRSGLSSNDPYSFTSDIPWVNHEWLAELLMYGAWAAGGNAGLIALKMAVVCATLVLVLLTLRHDRLPSLTRDLLVVVVLLGLWARVFVVRPQLFSILLFAMLLWILRSAERGRQDRVWILPVVFSIWVNVHGGWIVGVAALLVWTAVGLTPLGAGLLWGRLGGAAALALLATLANPYGLGLWSFLANTVSLNRPNINDWRPLTEAGSQVIVPWVLTAGLALLAIVRGKRRIPLSYALIAIGLGAASVRVNRLDVFFSLSVVMLLAPYVAPRARWQDRRKLSREPRPKWTVLMQAAAVALVIGLGLAGWRQRDVFTCLRLDGPWMPEREAGAFILANRLEGRLLSWFDWGQYAIWHFAPGLKVSLDGRRETVYSDAFVAQHLKLYYEPDTSLAMLDELAPAYAWLPTNLPLSAALNRAGWRRIYTGPTSIVFAREKSSLPDPKAGSTAPLGRACFPGP